RVARGAVVLADGAPSTLTDVWPPVLPIGAAGLAVGQAAVLGGRGVRHGRTPDGLGHDGRAAAIFLRRGASWMIPPHKVGGAHLLTEDTRSTALQQGACLENGIVKLGFQERAPDNGTCCIIRCSLLEPQYGLSRAPCPVHH